MALNVELLDKTLAYIEAHPEEHDQSDWVSGTQMCFAGHALVQAGHKVESRTGRLEERLFIDGEQCHWCTFPDLAQEELGIGWYEATELFYDAETLADVRETVSRIKANHNIT